MLLFCVLGCVYSCGLPLVLIGCVSLAVGLNPLAHICFFQCFLYWKHSQRIKNAIVFFFCVLPADSVSSLSLFNLMCLFAVLYRLCLFIVCLTMWWLCVLWCLFNVCLVVCYTGSCLIHASLCSSWVMHYNLLGRIGAFPSILVFLYHIFNHISYNSYHISNASYHLVHYLHLLYHYTQTLLYSSLLLP